MGDGRKQHWKTGILPPKESCSGDQVATKYFGIRKSGNGVDHLRIEFYLAEANNMLVDNQPLVNLGGSVV